MKLVTMVTGSVEPWENERMSQMELRSRLVMRRHGRGGSEPTPWPMLVVDMILLPRGSGNRNRARRIADRWRKSEVMAPFVEKIITGASKVRVHLTCSPELQEAVREAQKLERESQDLPGQLGLFAG